MWEWGCFLCPPQMINSCSGIFFHARCCFSVDGKQAPNGAVKYKSSSRLGFLAVPGMFEGGCISRWYTIYIETASYQGRHGGMIILKNPPTTLNLCASL